MRCDRRQRAARQPDLDGHVRSPTRCGSASPRERASAAEAQKVGNEVEALYTNGPAGGGGATKSVREVVSVASTFVPRSLVSCTIHREVV